MTESAREPPRSAHRFGRKDIIEIAIGSCVLVLPLAITEEAWNLGHDLPLLNALCFVLASYVLIGIFVYYRIYHGNLKEHGRREFLARVGTVYLVTLTVASLCLLGIDKLPLCSEPWVAIKRTILVSVPGCFVATVVDSMH